MAGSFNNLRSRGFCRAGRPLGDARQAAPDGGGTCHSRRGPEASASVRGIATHMRRSRTQRGLPAPRQRLMGSDQGSLRIPRRKAPVRGDGRPVDHRGGPGEPGPAVDARRLPAGLHGSIVRHMDALDARLRAYVPGARHPGVSDHGYLPRRSVGSGACWPIFTARHGTPPSSRAPWESARRP